MQRNISNFDRMNIVSNGRVAELVYAADLKSAD